MLLGAIVGFVLGDFALRDKIRLSNIIKNIYRNLDHRRHS